MSRNVVQRFRSNYTLRSYRRQLAAPLGEGFVFRQLPGLKDVSMIGLKNGGVLQALSTAIAGLPAATLAGELGSGRRLALRQVALLWAATTGAPIPAPLVLPQIDDGTTEPATLIERELARRHPTLIDQEPELFAPRAQHPVETAAARWGLLVEGLEELAPERQAAWRTALQQLPRTHGAWLHVLVPNNETPWPGFDAVRIPKPSADMVRAWLHVLCEPPQRDMLLPVLQPGGALELLNERLIDVALLAWVTRGAELPRSRAELYQQATIRLLRTVGGAGVSMDELQRLAAYDEPPSAPVPGLLAATATGGVTFTHPLARLYLAAHQLVAEQRYDLITHLDGAERTELARFAAGIADDPAPVFAALWGQQPSADTVLLLGRCLRERSSTPQTWLLRIIGALALLARNGGALQRGQSLTLLRSLMPQLDAALRSLPADNSPIARATSRLLPLLPDELGLPRQKQLAFDAATPHAVAWTVADQLVALGAPAADVPPADLAALARWAYVQVLGSDESRARLLDAVDELATLIEQSSAGAERVQRVAAALAHEPRSARAQQIGQRMLAQPGVPSVAVPEPAPTAPMASSADALPPIAPTIAPFVPPAEMLDAMTVEQPEPAPIPEPVATVPTVALDQAALLPQRLEDVEALIAAPQPAFDLLARCARDTTLPLYGRLLAIAALRRDQHSAPTLLDLLHDADQATPIRSTAARTLGALHEPAAREPLLALIRDAATPIELAEEACAALGALGDQAAHPPLLDALAASAADPELTVAVLRALGALAAPETVAPLSGLLGTAALERLHQAAGRTNLQHTSAAAIQQHILPERLAARLTAVVQASCTPAALPTTLGEFLVAEADAIRGAAAHALAHAGGEEARLALHAVLVDDAAGGATDSVLDALAQTGAPDGAAALHALLLDHAAPPMTRWLAAQRLREIPNGMETLSRALMEPDLDPFIRGTLAEALGQSGTLDAVPQLRQLVLDPRNSEHLRGQAIIALGLLDDPAIEGTLLQLLRANTEHEALRGLAAEHMPTALSPAGREWLRDTLRRDQPPAALAAGALRSLGRAHDNESLSLLLTYAQDERAAVAQAALLALGEVADASMTPVVLHISQNPNADPATRLQAISVLLRINGSSYRPLLRAALDHGPLSLRFQALEHLLDANTPASELVGILAGIEWPLPMRLRLLEHSGTSAAARPVLLGILENKDDHLLLRCRVLDVLGSMAQTDTVPVLSRIAWSVTEPAALRLRAIEALGAVGGTEAGLGLAQLSDHRQLPASGRRAAARMLVHLANRSVYEAPQ